MAEWYICVYRRHTTNLIGRLVVGENNIGPSTLCTKQDNADPWFVVVEYTNLPLHLLFLL